MRFVSTTTFLAIGALALAGCQQRDGQANTAGGETGATATDMAADTPTNGTTMAPGGASGASDATTTGMAGAGATGSTSGGMGGGGMADPATGSANGSGTGATGSNPSGATSPGSAPQ